MHNKRIEVPMPDNERNFPWPMIVIPLVAVFLCLGYWLFRGAQETSGTPTVIANSAPENNTRGLLAGNAVARATEPSSIEVVDTTWSPKIYEMLVPSDGSVSCTISTGETITFTGNGSVLQVSSSRGIYFYITQDDVIRGDANSDHWVKLANFGGISVGYVNGQWKSDWLKGCPRALSTPVDP